MSAQDTAIRGNGVVGILSEAHNKWERRAPLTPPQCARLLHTTVKKAGVERIIVQPCTKRIHHDTQYEDVGCEILEDLSECGLILGVKQPKLGTLLPDRAYAFFSHTHKAQPQNVPLLEEVLAKKVSLYDYELIVGEDGRRLVAFGEYAGRAGMIDFLRGLGERFLSLGYSTPFLSLGSSYMYSSLSAAKAAVVAVGDEISSGGLLPAICPLTFVFTGSGKVSQGAQEIFRLLPHSFVNPAELKEMEMTLASRTEKHNHKPRKIFQLYGCIVTPEFMVAPNDSKKNFDKADYYSHPEQYHSVFHENIAPFASVIVNCIYWEKRYPRLLTNSQLRELSCLNESRQRDCGVAKLVGIADISCDLGGAIECINQIGSIEQPFFRYDPISGSYYKDLHGREGIILLAVDNLPAEFAKEATMNFGNVLHKFLPTMAYAHSPDETHFPIQRACIAHDGHLTSLYEYILRMRESETRSSSLLANQNGNDEVFFKKLVSLSGHLFDQFLINEALDVIEKAEGRFSLVTCEVGQTVDAVSHAELEVIADSAEKIDQIVDTLASIASHENATHKSTGGHADNTNRKGSCSKENCEEKVASDIDGDRAYKVLIMGAGRMCEPAVKYLALGNTYSDIIKKQDKARCVIVASLFLEDAEKVVAGIPYTTAVQLDVMDTPKLEKYISTVSVVISLLPPSHHLPLANACIKLGKHLVTASYVSEEMAALDEKAKQAGVTLLCEMGLDPGIDHMMAMKMIDAAHTRGGKVQSFVSYCGGLPSPAAANNPLGYKFSWNPAGSLKAGRNSAVYKHKSEIMHIPGEKLFSSAIPMRLPHLPAFALERLANRDSLMYGNFYGISDEACTVFRATLRYEGFSEIMDVLGQLGFFSSETHPLLLENSSGAVQQLSYVAFLEELFSLSKGGEKMTPPLQVSESKACAFQESAEGIVPVANRLSRFLGLDSKQTIPATCKTPFDILCTCMEDKLLYKPDEQDMILLHHDLEVTFRTGGPVEHHAATLLTFGEFPSKGDCLESKAESAMARTVGLTAAIGAELLLSGTLHTEGVVRPFSSDIYLPVLKALEALGLKVEERMELL
ncbi:hypothetical protein O6H91_18G008500 [Diphasiastrum complanatum]|uniref:Uncharacterized protein n=4 Tax=Diphasiastrum complanatum TaxID=34168 RepID=A0ACC2AY21_DIPCM|nr:hypothetical protein O6H91_18G008500 [Diphasiastrum complanatum]KAJ7522379.1 hypothetical protein O6H91_18G008500 [Diphasiastrum complanatum]KAJ7522381.1 hypothetical protein O6H91_18G008500 [Diphasiastrum complanatum]KAJ7522385.1 hypothetical protein O6H91_18G008500 [Diphasiastrum complanatum]